MAAVLKQERDAPHCCGSIPVHAAGIGPIDDAAVAAGEPGDLLHLRRAERKIEDRRILRQPLFFAGSRDDDNVLLHEIAQANLRRGLAVCGADPRQKLVISRAAARDRTIGDDRHAVLAAGGDHLRLVEKRMTFDLIANERLGRKPHRLLDELDGEIGHPDMARQPIALDLAQRAERIGERDLRIGPVQQQQIEFAQAQPAERVARGPFEIARPTW